MNRAYNRHLSITVFRAGRPAIWLWQVTGRIVGDPRERVFASGHANTKKEATEHAHSARVVLSPQKAPA